MTYTNENPPVGDVWRLHHGGREVVRLSVTGFDMPWMYADVEELPGFEPFRPLFAEQELALDDPDDPDGLNAGLLDACDARIRAALTMTYPDGILVPEFFLRLHGDGTAGWRWHHEPFDTDAPGEGGR